MIKYLVFLGSAWVQLSRTGKKWISVIEEIRPVSQTRSHMYLKERPIDREDSPLVWWRENQHRFSKISKVARRFLTIPITSTPSERVFSTAGLTVTQLRSSLTPKHVNMLVFLNKNTENS